MAHLRNAFPMRELSDLRPDLFDSASDAVSSPSVLFSGPDFWPSSSTAGLGSTSKPATHTFLSSSPFAAKQHAA